MKKTILFALLALLIPSICLAGSVQDKLLAVLSAGGAAACSTVHATNASAHSNYINHNNASGTSFYVGQWNYDPGANISVCKVDLVITAAGTVTGKNYYLDIYTQGAGTPAALNTLLGTSDVVAGSSAWNLTTVSFSFSTPVAISNGTNYSFVLRNDAAGSDSNTARVSYSAAGGLGGYWGTWKSDKAGSTWGTEDVRLTIYK